MFFILAAAAEVARLGDGVRILSMERLRACNIIESVPMTTFKKDLNIARTTPNNIVCTDHGSRNSRMSKLRTPVGGVLTLSTDPWREAARDNNTLTMTATVSLPSIVGDWSS